MTDPTWDGKVAAQVFRQLRDMSSGIIRDTHTLRDAAGSLAEAAKAKNDPELAEMAQNLASLANVIDSDAFNLHEVNTLLALLDLQTVRTQLGIAKKAPNKTQAARRTSSKDVTQELTRAQTD